MVGVVHQRGDYSKSYGTVKSVNLNFRIFEEISMAKFDEYLEAPSETVVKTRIDAGRRIITQVMIKNGVVKMRSDDQSWLSSFFKRGTMFLCRLGVVTSKPSRFKVSIDIRSSLEWIL